jgi:hypothetical protein
MLDEIAWFGPPRPTDSRMPEVSAVDRPIRQRMGLVSLTAPHFPRDLRVPQGRRPNRFLKRGLQACMRLEQAQSGRGLAGGRVRPVSQALPVSDRPLAGAPAPRARQRQLGRRNKTSSRSGLNQYCPQAWFNPQSCHSSPTGTVVSLMLRYVSRARYSRIKSKSI